jgi:hypothetical protein
MEKRHARKELFGFWGLLFGSAFFIIPGIGPVIVGGPLVSWIVGALETAVVTGGLTALGGALTGIGIPKDSVVRYETALKADKFVLVAHGTAQEAEKAKSILAQNKAEEASVHGDVTGKLPAMAA